MSVLLPTGPTQTAPSVPLAASPTSIPLARTSPYGTLRVELVGFAGAVGPTKAYPAVVCRTTVRLPTTASVPVAGTPALPATPNERGTFLAKGPGRPVPWRVSRIRDGSSGTNVAPHGPGTKYPVMSKIRSVEAVLFVPTNVADTLPSESSPTVMLFARVS